jgi:hypothetical protein
LVLPRQAPINLSVNTTAARESCRPAFDRAARKELTDMATLPAAQHDHSGSDFRDWNWDTDGVLEGLYVETRIVNVANGPSAGERKLVFDFHVGLEDELVSLWETSVLNSKFREELRARGKSDFEPGERFVITPNGTKTSAAGNNYRDFEVTFEHAAPKLTPAELLAQRETEKPEQDDEQF